jgi:hypothetical protein
MQQVRVRDNFSSSVCPGGPGSRRLSQAELWWTVTRRRVTMPAVDRLITTPMAERRVRRRARLSVPAFGVLASALALAACGGGSAAPSSSAPAAGGHKGRPTTATTGGPRAGSDGSSSGGSASGIPKACTLVAESQVSAALGVPINRTSETPNGSGTECSWTYKPGRRGRLSTRQEKRATPRFGPVHPLA